MMELKDRWTDTQIFGRINIFIPPLFMTHLKTISVINITLYILPYEGIGRPNILDI